MTYKRRAVLFFVFSFAFALIFSLYASAGVREAFDLCFPRYAVWGVVKETGEEVKILEAEHEKHFWVMGKNGLRRKVAWDALAPKATASVPVDAVDEKTVAYFAGAMGMKSKTDYLIWTDLSRFKTYVLEYGDEGWQVIRTLPCALGDASHPTPSGTYAVDYKCTSIGKENQYLCRYALCFYGGYMYHSVLYDWGGKALIDERLGERISHGCVRLSPADSRWLYNQIPIGTTVFIR